MMSTHGHRSHSKGPLLRLGKAIVQQLGQLPQNQQIPL